MFSYFGFSCDSDLMADERRRVEQCLTIDFCTRCRKFYDSDEGGNCETCNNAPPHDISLRVIRKAARRRNEQHQVQFQESQRVRFIGGVQNKRAPPQVGRGSWLLPDSDVEKFAFRVLVDTGSWMPDNPFQPPGNGLAEGLFKKSKI